MSKLITTETTANNSSGFQKIKSFFKGTSATGLSKENLKFIADCRLLFNAQQLNN